MLSAAQRKQIIQAAIYAPSADNSQPFLFYWKNNHTLELWIDAKRSGKASDNRFILSDIALGAVIENIIIYTESLTLSTNIDYFPNNDMQTLLVAIIYFSLEGKPSSHSSLINEIAKRCTDRRFPFKGPISKATIDLLTTAAKLHDCGLISFKSQKAIKKVLPVIQQAETIRFKSKILHQELFSTINFENHKSDEGMPISTLAIEKIALPLFKQMKKWSVMNFFNKIGGATILSFRSVRLPILLSPALILITIKNKDRLSVLKAGRAIQRVWLQASQQGLSVQPYAAPGIFSLGYISCEKEFKLQLEEITKKMYSLVNQNSLGENNYGLIFLRIGFNKPVEKRSNRRTIESFTKSF